MDLSRQFSHSVNDAVREIDYTLHYNSVDDTIRIVTDFGAGTLMAKLGLKRAFRLIPVHPFNWNLLGYSFDNLYYLIRFCLSYVRILLYSTVYRIFLCGPSNYILSIQMFSTIWTIFLRQSL